MNLNAYDSITEKIDKTKTWIDTKKCILLSREIKYRKYYVLSRRFNTELNTYDYFIILLDEKPTDRVSYQTRIDDYGRVKIRLYDLYRESTLSNLEKDTNISITKVEHQDDGDIYQLDVQSYNFLHYVSPTSRNVSRTLVYYNHPVRKIEN